MHILEQIDRDLDELSRSEARVARWIRSHAREAVAASISEVAAAASVSEPTVIRFCRSLGVSGFRAFKTHLISALQRPESYLHQDVQIDDTPETAAAKVLDSSIRALVDQRELAARMPFGAAVKVMAGARQLLFIGLGASGHVAADACHKFFRLGIPCSAVTDAQTMLQRAAIAETTDLFVAISHSGTWPEAVTAMQVARDRGATIIALTDPPSPLARTADLLFPCHASEDINVFTPMSSRLVQLALLDALQVSLALEMGGSAERNLMLSKDVLVRERWPDQDRE